MTNTNSLANIKCPACGNEELFRIAAKTIATVTDDGVEDYGDMEWDDDSYAECAECCRHGTLKDFKAQMASDDYFRGPTGTRYGYAEIADRIRREAPHTVGKHISVQLEAIGLYDELMNGATPCGLPFTFADAAGIASQPPAPKLLASLEAILPYAESEAYSLEKLKDSPEAEAEAQRAWKAVEAAQALVAQANGAGMLPATDGRPPRFEFTYEPEENPDRAYVLVDGKFDVKIIRTAEGVVVDVYPRHGIDSIASTYAFDTDAEAEESEEA